MQHFGDYSNSLKLCPTRVIAQLKNRICETSIPVLNRGFTFNNYLDFLSLFAVHAQIQHMTFIQTDT